MAFDGIVTKAITHEFKNILIGGKIDKIHQPDKNTIILGIYSNSVHYALNICIDAHNCRINLTENSKLNPLVAPNFCMLLRKYLIGGKISNIEMYGLERLVKIDIEILNDFNEIEIKSLIIELMGKHSNIILINNKNIIIDALRHIYATDTIYRNIIPSRTYTLPISDKLDYTQITNIYNIFQDNLNLSIEEFAKLFANTFTGFSLSFVKFSIEKCNINAINKENILKLESYINEILSFPNNLKFVEIYKNNKISDFVLSSESNTSTEFTLNKFIDNFYFNRENLETFNNFKNNALKITTDSQKKLLNRLNSIDNKLKDCDEKDKYRLYGELITSNLYKLTNTHTDYIELENYYDNNNLIKIPLDKKYSPSVNAKHYFKKYNKLKNALQIVSVQKSETENELNYIESIIYEIESTSSISEIQEILDEISENLINKKKPNLKKKNSKVSKKKKYEKQYSPLHFNIDNFDVYVGRNNKENDWLTFTFANKNDIWLHTKDIQGSHVILKTSGIDISDDTLVKCAKLAVEHSKARLSSNVPVDYCKVQYVKKPNGAKPGMVIFTNNKTISVTSYNNKETL